MIEDLQARFLAAVARIRVSPRERAMLALLGVVLSFYAALSSFEWAMSARAGASEARAARLSFEQQAAARRSRPFRTTIEREAGKVRAWSLAEPTIYIARVRAESDLALMAREAGIANVRTVADRSDEFRPPVQPLTVNIEGDFDWRSFLPFLSRLATAGPVFVPTALEVEEIPPSAGAVEFSGPDAVPPDGRFRLSIQVPYRGKEHRS